MTAQPVHHDTPPVRLPNTVAAIRAALPAGLRPRFQTELDEAVDSCDMGRVDAVKGRWWAQAMLEVDPTIREDWAAADRGELDIVPAPFAAR